MYQLKIWLTVNQGVNPSVDVGSRSVAEYGGAFATNPEPLGGEANLISIVSPSILRATR